MSGAEGSITISGGGQSVTMTESEFHQAAAAVMSNDACKIINSLASIKHLNIRKEGPDDDKVLAIDIKFGGAVADMALLSRILGSDNVATVKAAFWDEAGNIRFSGMDPITSWAQIGGCSAKVGGLSLIGKTHKFKARLQSEYKIELEFSITVTDPPANAASILAEYVQDDVRVVIEKEQGELELGQQQEAQSEAE